MNKNILLSTSALLLTLNLLAIFPKHPKKPVGRVTNINYDNAIYKNKNTLVYKIVHRSASHHIVNIDTMGLTCSSNISVWNNQHVCTWYYMTVANNGYAFNYKRYENEEPGMAAIGTFFFIIPPRSGDYRILQFCPFPEFEKKTIGGTWHWDFVVGALWAIPKLYPINSTDTFHIDYTLVDSTTIHLQDSIKLNNYFSPNTIMMSDRSYFCYHLSAVSVSRFGKAYGDYYYNNEIGLIYFKLTPVDGSSYEFTFLALIK